jgi:C-terminal processing protease CtpA/Prc
MKFRTYIQSTFRLPSLLSCIAICLLYSGVIAPHPAYGQQTLNNQRLVGVEMLDLIKKDIKKNYYDPTFRGVDLDKQFNAAAEKVKAASSIGEILGIVARLILEFDDSHTFFIIPPPRDYIQQGWAPQIIGNKCYVIAVKPGSDAEAKGLKPGDEIISMAGLSPTRIDLWKNWYFLQYQPSISLYVRNDKNETNVLAPMAEVKPGKAVYNLRSSTGADWVNLIRQTENYYHLWRHRYVESDDLLIWKMPFFGSEDNVDEMMSKARKRKALILDLRSNGGGYEDTLLRLTGYMFDHDIKIGDIKSRTDTKPLMAKTRGAGRIFTGKLVVLVDSDSGSAAELFARIVQIEKRGVVIGDVTSGRVMQARAFGHQAGMDLAFYYGVSVAIADLIMTDGKSLERVGVTPDELLLPSSAALATQRDPVLSRAAELAGFTLTPEKAGTLFPIEWPD